MIYKDDQMFVNGKIIPASGFIFRSREEARAEYEKRNLENEGRDFVWIYLNDRTEELDHFEITEARIALRLKSGKHLLGISRASFGCYFDRKQRQLELNFDD
jgi:hypothetical protein